MKKLNHNRRRGQALTEYALIIGAVVLMCAAAVSIFGHKTADLWASVAAILPGAHDDDAGPIVSGKLINTTEDGTNGLELDIASIAAGNNTLPNNSGLNTLGTAMVLEANTAGAN